MMAKSLIRNRHAVTKLYALKSQLQGVSLRIQVSRPRAGFFVCALLLGVREGWGRGCCSQLALERRCCCGPLCLRPSHQTPPLPNNPPPQTLKSTQAMAEAMRGATKVRVPLIMRRQRRVVCRRVGETLTGAVF